MNFMRQSLIIILLMCTWSMHAQVTAIEQFYLKYAGKNLRQNFKTRPYLDEITYPNATQRALLLQNKKIVINELEAYHLITQDSKNAYIQIEYTNAAIR